MAEMVLEMITPPQLAKRWGVDSGKVRALIDSGQLKAINLAVNPKGRPRYRIAETEIERFQEARTTRPPEPKTRRRRAVKTTKEFFK